MAATLTIDGFGPLPLVTPATVAEACAIVRQQRAAKQAVYPVGGGTMLDFGLVPNKPGVAVSTKALNKVIDYPARDMTITVQAGITLAELQAVFGTENQWLPLDAPHPERCTLGGLVATNTSGPRRLGYGTLRDFVLGIEFINDTGNPVHGGGRVVKNVAGYDLMKLNIGALGAFGLITQLTLKVRPKPEATRVVTAMIERSHFYDVLEVVGKSDCCPVACHAVYLDEWMLFVGFEEKAVTVNAKIGKLRKDLEVFYLGLDADEDAVLWEAVLELSNGGSTEFTTRYSVRPSDVKTLAESMAGNVIAMDPLNGILTIHHMKPIHPQGHRQGIMLRAPTTWKTPERIFGPPTPAFELMRHIKRTLDPENVFNPGRMFV